MKRIWCRTAVSGLLAMVTLGLIPAGTASADPVTFGVRPATATAPDNRPNFSIGATPGAVIKDHVAVANISDGALKLKVYASDAFNSDDGGFDLLASGRKPVDVGAWTTTEFGEIEVPGRSTKIVPFTVTVPANASPGDHVGGIVAALVTEATGSDGQKVAVEQRVGSRIYLRVSGDLKPQLSIEDLTGDYDGNFFGGGDTKISYTVRNTGNIRLGGSQKVTIETPWGAVTEAPGLPALPELLPGSTYRVNATVSGVLPAGWLDGAVHIDPVASAGTTQQISAVDANVTVTAVPWVLVTALLVVLALVLFLVWRKRKRRSVAVMTDPEPQPEVANASA